MRRGDEYCFVRMVNRFMEKYKKKLKSKLFRLKNVKFSHMFSLTVDKNRFGWLMDGFVWVGKQFARFRAWLYKLYGRFDYVKVLEITKKGRPHLHVLVRFIDCDVSYIPYDTVYSLSGRVIYRGIQNLWGAFGWVRRWFNGLAGSGVS